MAINTVLFDLDGTLVDSLPLIEQTYFRVFRDLHIPWDNREVMRWVGIPLKDIGNHYAKERCDQFMELYQHYYYQKHDTHTKLFPETQELIEYLREQKYHLGIVTSKRRPVTIKTLELTGTRALFDVVITAQDVQKHKPEPEPVLKALTLLKVIPEVTVFVGDSIFDIQAGKGAGVKTAGVTWGLASRKELAEIQPDLLINNWQDLITWLEKPEK
jgi:pyrophosphatase PpaX